MVGVVSGVDGVVVSGVVCGVVGGAVVVVVDPLHIFPSQQFGVKLAKTSFRGGKIVSWEVLAHTLADAQPNVLIVPAVVTTNNNGIKTFYAHIRTIFIEHLISFDDANFLHNCFLHLLFYCFCLYTLYEVCSFYGMS